MEAEQLSPPLVYGTAWKEDETPGLTRLALECGFRGIDTANQRKHYFEAGVGEALAAAFDDGLVTRDELFIQTKFTYERGQDHRLPYDPGADYSDQVEQSLTSSLEHLHTTYVDALLLHGPSTAVGIADPDRRVWRKLESLAGSDRVGAIGVSNVTADQLQTLIDWADTPPAYVQNRCFARTAWDHEVRQICNRNDIVYQGFSLLTANVRALRTQIVSAAAQRHEKTIPQVVFRFADQVGMLPLTGTTDETHMREDLACFDFRLTDDEVQAIERVAT